MPVLVLVAVALYQYYQDQPTGTTPQPADSRQSEYRETRSWHAGEWIVIQGQVRRLLSDDQEGSSHQRFIVELPDRRTLLVAHNIDLAERVPVSVGDTIRLRGQFEPNERGGVVHWTHHDPGGSTSAGWIEYRNRRYQ
jgi:hypothetical protein